MNEESLKISEQIGFRKCKKEAMIIIHEMSKKAKDEDEVFNKLGEAFDAISELELNP